MAYWALMKIAGLKVKYVLRGLNIELYNNYSNVHKFIPEEWRQQLKQKKKW